MLRRRVELLLLAAALAVAPVFSARLSADEFEDQEPVGSPVTKLARGGLNLFTGWMEIPKRIHETSQNSGTAVSFTWGLLRGVGYGFVRTAAGVYEIVTFPFAAPPDYEPVIQPPYVWSDAATANNDHDF